MYFRDFIRNLEVIYIEGIYCFQPSEASASWSSPLTFVLARAVLLP